MSALRRVRWAKRIVDDTVAGHVPPARPPLPPAGAILCGPAATLADLEVVWVFDAWLRDRAGIDALDTTRLPARDRIEPYGDGGTIT